MRDEKDRVRKPRIGLGNEAMLILADGSQVAVTLIDISQHGFRARSQELLEVGEEIALRDHRGEARAQVRWVNGFEAGCLFLSGSTEFE